MALTNPGNHEDIGGCLLCIYYVPGTVPSALCCLLLTSPVRQRVYMQTEIPRQFDSLPKST